MKTLKDMMNYRIECKTEKELKDVLNTLYGMGAKWRCGESMLDNVTHAPCYLYIRETGVTNSKMAHSPWDVEKMVTAKEFLNEVQENRVIVIYRKDNSVFAVEKINGNPARTAEARCCPEDSFNFDVGAELAFERLIGELPPLREPMKIVKQDEYAVGDKVLIKKWDDMVKDYGLDSDGNIHCRVGIWFSRDMKKYCNKIMEVVDVTPRGRLELNGACEWSFTPEMIVGKLL